MPAPDLRRRARRRRGAVATTPRRGRARRRRSGAGIVLGKHSGRNAVATRLRELGYDPDPEKLNAVFVRFKEVAERKKGGLDDDDLEALVADEVYSAQALWSLKRVQVSTGSDVVPTATVAL